MTSEIAEAFQKLRRDTPDRALVLVPGVDTVLTVTAVAECATQVGRALDAAGVSPRGLVAAAIGNRPAAVAAFLACRQRGGPFLPLDIGTPVAEMGVIGSQFGAAAILLATPQSIVGFSRLTPIAGGLTVALPDKNAGESRYPEAAVLKMTSGSTGNPRLTLTPEASLATDSRNLMASMDVRPHDIQIAAIPLSHAYGFGNLLVPLLLQGTAIVMREAFVPQRLPDDARRSGARVFPGVPFMFEHFVTNPSPEGWPAGLCRLLTAGAPIERSTVEKFRERFGVKIHSFYGTSETGGITFDDSDGPAGEGMVGKPLPDVSLTLMPQDGAPSGGGRVLVKGPAVIRGYADGIDAESFVEGGFLTGDLGTIDDNDQLWLSGRISSFVNVAGRKVQPDEVERVLRTMDGVADVRVLGVADVRRGEQLVACLVMQGEPPATVWLRQYCAARLAAYKIPRSFVFLDEIPLTERGKTDRRRLESAVLAALKRNAGML